MKKSSFVLIAAANLLACSVSAGTMGSITPPQDWAWVGSLSVGPAWASAGKTQTFYLAPEIIKTYSATQKSNALAAGELFVGIQKALSTPLQGQLGLALAASGNAHLQGIIWDDADPQFNNHSYKYNINHRHIAVKGKLLMDNGYWVIPWVSGSLGVGFNRAHDYSNTPLIFEALPNPNFSNHTQTAFTYTLGAGLQKPLSTHWQVGVGYEFADWGKSQLGRAQGQTLGSGLVLNHLYTNGVVFNISYVG